MKDATKTTGLATTTSTGPTIRPSSSWTTAGLKTAMTTAAATIIQAAMGRLQNEIAQKRLATVCYECRQV